MCLNDGRAEVTPSPRAADADLGVNEIYVRSSCKNPTLKSLLHENTDSDDVELET